mgnify:CR=1 FL=1
MYTNFSLEEVIAAVDDFLVKSGLSDNTLSRYRRFGFNYFRDGFSAEGYYFYSEELAESLVAKFHQQVLNGQRSERDFRTIRKAWNSRVTRNSQLGRLTQSYDFFCCIWNLKGSTR